MSDNFDSNALNLFKMVILNIIQNFDKVKYKKKKKMPFGYLVKLSNHFSIVLIKGFLKADTGKLIQKWPIYKIKQIKNKNI